VMKSWIFFWYWAVGRITKALLLSAEVMVALLFFNLCLMVLMARHSVLSFWKYLEGSWLCSWLMRSATCFL